MPMFQRVGKTAYKAGLENIEALCAGVGNPQLNFKSVHVAGTNGKGSSSHYLAAILQSSSLKVGLFTSPHLKRFTERVKINGIEVEEEYVIQFVHENKALFEKVKPSFFELTTVLAFKYFADQAVDIAVIEVGMGGRLDSTNIIQPIVSLITNIGLDHIDYLGDTLEKIAVEKGGIIKPTIPVVISEFQPETLPVFESLAQNVTAPLIKAFENYLFGSHQMEEGKLSISLMNNLTQQEIILQSELMGIYQLKNCIGVLTVIDVLKNNGFTISDEAILNGFSKVIQLTNLKGRWQQLGESPYLFCDTGHNAPGVALILEQLSAYQFQKLYIVLGLVNDKSPENVLSLLPKNAYYLFCQASIPRAMDAKLLAYSAENHGLNGEVVHEVNEAIAKAKSLATEKDFILVGGSTFVVAEIDGL